MAKFPVQGNLVFQSPIHNNKALAFLTFTKIVAVEYRTLEELWQKIIPNINVGFKKNYDAYLPEKYEIKLDEL